MPISIMGSDTNWKEYNNINTPACALSFYHDEMPLASIKQRLARIIQNTFCLCRVSLNSFVGQPCLKQLYVLLSFDKRGLVTKEMIGPQSVPVAFTMHFVF